MSPELIISAFLLDLILGEPGGLPHPVQLIGIGVTRLEGLLGRAADSPSSRRTAGAVMVIIIVSATLAATLLVVELAYGLLGRLGGELVSVYLAYTVLSARGLAHAALEVKRPLESGDLAAARRALSGIVGRDTEGLDEVDTARGAVETVAENSSDGIVAPLFYLALGGPALAMAYKAVNTMDSMVGYKNEKYADFGWAAARLDDIANFIPARLAAIFIAAASAPLGLLFKGWFSAAGAWRIFLRDWRNHPSPNSGCPESAMAGSLGVRLGGRNSYFGMPSEKPYIGEPVRAIGSGTITASVILMYGAAVIAVLFSAVLSKIVFP